jgi:hypothetical protein
VDAARPPVLVLGLYNSGSTALAGALHRLGVDMGAPFWSTSDEDSPGNYYEPWDLSDRLRVWWNEPTIREGVERPARVAYLAGWLAARSHRHRRPVGAKHPLLSLCGADVVDAWGGGTRVIRAWRPLDESVARLQARRWFPGAEVPLQRALWGAAEGFCTGRPHLRVEYARLRADPAAVLAELVTFTRLAPTPEQMAAAVAFIRGGGRG